MDEETQTTEIVRLTEAESEALTRVENYLGCYDESASEAVDEVQFGLSVYALTLDDVRTLAAAVDRIPALLLRARADERERVVRGVGSLHKFRQAADHRNGVVYYADLCAALPELLEADRG